MNPTFNTLETLRWDGRTLAVLDQRLLPGEARWIAADSLDLVIDAIRTMAVRGAPAIGIAAAYGAVLAARARPAFDEAAWNHDLDRLAEARPTAVNLRWAIDRMRRVAARAGADPGAALEAEARALHAEDLTQNRAMGEAGAAFIPPGSRVMTHCNTGALPTGGWGTPLGVIRSAWAQGRIERVFATETRPWLQGARLTAWELAHDGIRPRPQHQRGPGLQAGEGGSKDRNRNGARYEHGRPVEVRGHHRKRFHRARTKKEGRAGPFASAQFSFRIPHCRLQAVGARGDPARH